MPYNPKSKLNLRQSKNAKPTRLTLSPKAREVTKQVGNGNMSEGVERMSDVISEAKLAIECLLGEHPAGKELGERVLVKLEELEIKQILEEFESEQLPRPKGGAIII